MEWVRREGQTTHVSAHTHVEKGLGLDVEELGEGLEALPEGVEGAEGGAGRGDLARQDLQARPERLGERAVCFKVVHGERAIDVVWEGGLIGRTDGRTDGRTWREET